ncbi:hypothetical protein SLEP1_g54752 [Rubroshorea leprosula]|uniref:Leucine-rich repeat-containing N-terminal plant-type domain-containing protein n=1 Tax=Rubroshorea leprosula TaxID=152421 RepID=A0AAV5MH46_9ROSI|nr:hypothetical protein SLEP1_g54752 [Rubroshorea leprosula]
MQTSIGSNSTTTDDGVKCIKSERQALLAFKQGLVDEHGRLSSWGSEEEKKNCCEWEGVQCSNTTGHITMLNLTTYLYDRHFILRGNLSPSLFKLQHLIFLGLSGNNFNLSHIPESIGSLNKMQHLDLYYCNLSGSLPSQLANLTNLQYLDLSYNKFNIQSLVWLYHLSYLQYLRLGGNDLSKYFPIINTSSTSVVHLDLGSNNLTASTFQWLFNFSNSLVSLDLSSNQFRGPIPETFSCMTLLEELLFSNNQLEGGIPKSFGNLCKLRYLYLYDNYLDGILLELIGNLSGCLQLSLEELYLGKNKIRGPLPDMIKNFRSLRVLGLFKTQLSGAIPKSIRLLSNLVEIYISSNSLNGTIRESHFSTLSKLRGLSMSSNSLSINFSNDWIPPFQLEWMVLRLCKLGPKFPSWLKSQRNFSYLDISGSEISDSIPKWFWNLSSRVCHLNLSSNHIYGILPDLSTQISNSFGLGIDLSENKLEGPLPVFPVNVTSISLSKNRFNGSISSLCTISGGKLQFLDVSHNQLFGKLPDCMMQWTSLVILNLANNHLFGKIPSSIGSLYHLESLGLQNNSFSGEIPRGDIPLQLCWLTNLTLLDLSNNNLSGNIPSCIHNLTTLAQQKSSAHDHYFTDSHRDANSEYSGSYADKASVMWKGMERDYENGNLKTLKIIDLSSNNLTGVIPVHISVLFELVELNLSRNQLTGSIPSDIGQMRQLESLDLSLNQLSGHLPGSMSQLNFLSILNLSYNNFSGRIPLSTQMQSFDAYSFVGNPALCGLPLTPTYPDDEKSEDKPKNRDIAEFWQWFKLGMEHGVAIGFVGVLVVKLDHPWKHLCFLLFNNMKIRRAVGLNSTAVDHEVRCIERKRQVFLAFNQGLVDDYGVLSSWGSEEEKRDFCKRRGVQCSKATRRVIELILQDCSLRGKSCPFLFELQSFR